MKPTKKSDTLIYDMTYDELENEYEELLNISSFRFTEENYKEIPNEFGYLRVWELEFTELPIKINKRTIHKNFLKLNKTNLGYGAILYFPEEVYAKDFLEYSFEYLEKFSEKWQETYIKPMAENYKSFLSSTSKPFITNRDLEVKIGERKIEPPKSLYM